MGAPGIRPPLSNPFDPVDHGISGCGREQGDEVTAGRLPQRTQSIRIDPEDRGEAAQISEGRCDVVDLGRERRLERESVVHGDLGQAAFDRSGGEFTRCQRGRKAATVP